MGKNCWRLLAWKTENQGLGRGPREWLALCDGIEAVDRRRCPGSGCSHGWGECQGELPVFQGYSDDLLSPSQLIITEWVRGFVPTTATVPPWPAYLPAAPFTTPPPVARLVRRQGLVAKQQEFPK